MGEYYTPDWLCEHIVQKTLPATGYKSVLDPTCGSGSFLRATIAHYLKSNSSLTPEKQLLAILANVVGIDIHPLAVTIARITYLLSVAPIIHSARRPIQIPIYLADALFLPSEVSQHSLYEQEPAYKIRFGGNRSVAIPKALVENPDLFDPAIAACARVAADHAKNKHETLETLSAYLEAGSPDLKKLASSAAIEKALWHFTEELADLIVQEQDSIWAFIVRNAYRPAMMRNRFDFILGNPPWLAYRYIKDAEYQQEVKRWAQSKYKIASRKQKLLTQTELATVVLAHCLTTFGKVGCRLAFVMPYSVLRADQHEELRKRNYSAPFEIVGYWDLLRVKPLFRVPCCVLFAKKTGRPPRWAQSYELKAVLYKATLPAADLNWETAKPHVKAKRCTARLIFLGQRCAISEEKGRTDPVPAGVYARRFKNGATIYPRNFYFVRIKGEVTGKIAEDTLYTIETDRDRARNAKEPYKGLVTPGEIEGKFLYTTALSEHVLPFYVAPPVLIALPVLGRAGQLQLCNEQTLKKTGHRETAEWVARVEADWLKKQPGGKKREGASALATLDHHSKLTAQQPTDRHLVLYNASGTDVSAAYLDRNTTPRTFIVDHKLYYCTCNTRQEADYLCAVLNSDAVNQMIKPFQSMGLMGQRDIHKKLLELPIPPWNATRMELLRIARLGAKARLEAKKVMKARDGEGSVARRRKFLRNALGTTLKQIDGLVIKLLVRSA